MIKVSHIEWAHWYVSRAIEKFISKAKKEMGDNDFHKLANKAIGYVANVYAYSDDRRFSKFCKQGYMPKGS
jgi:GTP1/Obg family GTP-binding protein